MGQESGRAYMGLERPCMGLERAGMDYDRLVYNGSGKGWYMSV